MAQRTSILFATLTFIVIVLYLRSAPAASSHPDALFSMSPSSLVVRLSTAHPVLGAHDDTAHFTVTVSNPSTQPITVLVWGSPLDPKAAVAGIFKAVDVADPEHADIEGRKIMFRRITPPPRDDLVGIPPGGEVSAEVALQGFPFEAGKSYRVRVEGKWMSSWPVEKDRVTAEMLEEFGAREEMTGVFRSNEVTVRKA